MITFLFWHSFFIITVFFRNFSQLFLYCGHRRFFFRHFFIFWENQTGNSFVSKFKSIYYLIDIICKKGSFVPLSKGFNLKQFIYLETIFYIIVYFISSFNLIWSGLFLILVLFFDSIYFYVFFLNLRTTHWTESELKNRDYNYGLDDL